MLRWPTLLNRDLDSGHCKTVDRGCEGHTGCRLCRQGRVRLSEKLAVFPAWKLGTQRHFKRTVLVACMQPVIVFVAHEPNGHEQSISTDLWNDP